jgi:hypothetical protein
VLGRGNDDSGIPVASAKLDDVQDLLGGALFLPLFKWFREEGPVYRLAAGPRDFVIVSDPAVAKHVLRGYGTRYEKGLVAEVSQFLFGSGFAIAEGALWTVSSLFLSLVSTSRKQWMRRDYIVLWREGPGKLHRYLVYTIVITHVFAFCGELSCINCTRNCFDRFITIC